MAWTNFDVFTIEFTEPALAASSWVDSTYTIPDCTTNALYTLQPLRALSAGYVIGSVTCSTAAELRVRWINCGGSTVSGSTNRGVLTKYPIGPTSTVVSSGGGPPLKNY